MMVLGGSEKTEFDDVGETGIQPMYFGPPSDTYTEEFLKQLNQHMNEDYQGFGDRSD